MTKVDVISGFLGAGKTTLIKKLIEEKLNSEKLVIIENEFGEVGIDGSLLKNSGMEIKEINSGCICCTLVGDFTSSLKEVIHKYSPERIIIEPSGVGKLSDVLKACEAEDLKRLIRINMVITVVDITKYDIYINNFGEFFKNQIKYARTIMLSRTGNGDSKKLLSVADNIRKNNSKASIITTHWDSLHGGKIVDVAEGNLKDIMENDSPKPKVVVKRHMHSHDCKCGGHNHKDSCGCHSSEQTADQVFDVWGVETPKTFSVEVLNTLINKLQDSKLFGNVLRGKGIIKTNLNNWVQFDYVPGEMNVKDCEADYTTRICIIGSGLNKNELTRLFGV